MYSGVHSRICVSLLVGVALLCGTLRCAWSLPSCRYVDRNNAAHLVDSVQEAPIQYRDRVECEGDAGKALVPPEEVKMRGAVGKTVVRTEMGSFEVRWPRSIEQCFGKSPARATAEAAAALNRALKSAWFADSVKYSRQDWSLVFTDHATALREFPLAISRGGHPGFMVPPASIYLIADVISPGCAKGGVADGALIQVLLHEMGHRLSTTTGSGRRDSPRGSSSIARSIAASFRVGVLLRTTTPWRRRVCVTAHHRSLDLPMIMRSQPLSFALWLIEREFLV